ncbi:YHYH domain-containing protein [Acinetobacter sp. NIPH 2699]|uniref:YHYH domain-containing protein n=1 Tax=Acinetobacter sp. NIPH 2699 TaxID=2923433 RepID=UPI0032193AED
MKIRTILASLCLIVIGGLSTSSIAYMPELNHSGNTDKCGCHNTRSTGEYHCHNRKQRGGDCPP